MEELLGRLKFLLSLVIPLCYIVMGVYVLIEKNFITKLQPEFAYPLGAVLIAYGIFRFYRSYITLKKASQK